MVSKLTTPFTESTFSFRMNPKGGTGTNVQVRNQSTITDALYHQDAETSTRVETAEVGVSEFSMSP